MSHNASKWKPPVGKTYKGWLEEGGEGGREGVGVKDKGGDVNGGKGKGEIFGLET